MSKRTASNIAEDSHFVNSPLDSSPVENIRHNYMALSDQYVSLCIYLFFIYLFSYLSLFYLSLYLSVFVFILFYLFLYRSLCNKIVAPTGRPAPEGLVPDIWDLVADFFGSRGDFVAMMLTCKDNLAFWSDMHNCKLAIRPRVWLETHPHCGLREPLKFYGGYCLHCLKPLQGRNSAVMWFSLNRWEEFTTEMGVTDPEDYTYTYTRDSRSIPDFVLAYRQNRVSQHTASDNTFMLVPRPACGYECAAAASSHYYSRIPECPMCHEIVEWSNFLSHFWEYCRCRFFHIFFERVGPWYRCEVIKTY